MEVRIELIILKIEKFKNAISLEIEKFRKQS